MRKRCAVFCRSIDPDLLRHALKAIAGAGIEQARRRHIGRLRPGAAPDHQAGFVAVDAEQLAFPRLRRHRLDDLFETAFRNTQEVSYPPYNIVKTGQDNYKITLAVAGFGENDLELVVKENVLTVRGKVNDADKKDVTYLHRGIAGRSFEHRFQLADHVRVNGARLANGLLDIELVRELPEAMKPQRIEIGAGTAKPKVIEGKVKAA